MLALEGPTSRMYRLAGQTLYGETYRSIDTLLAEIEAVSADDVAQVADTFFDPAKQTVVWLGPN